MSLPALFSTPAVSIDDIIADVEEVQDSLVTKYGVRRYACIFDRASDVETQRRMHTLVTHLFGMTASRGLLMAHTQPPHITLHVDGRYASEGERIRRHRDLIANIEGMVERKPFPDVIARTHALAEAEDGRNVTILEAADWTPGDIAQNFWTVAQEDVVFFPQQPYWASRFQPHNRLESLYCGELFILTLFPELRTVLSDLLSGTFFGPHPQKSLKLHPCPYEIFTWDNDELYNSLQTVANVCRSSADAYWFPGHLSLFARKLAFFVGEMLWTDLTAKPNCFVPVFNADVIKHLMPFLAFHPTTFKAGLRGIHLWVMVADAARTIDCIIVTDSARLYSELRRTRKRCQNFRANEFSAFGKQVLFHPCRSSDYKGSAGMMRKIARHRNVQFNVWLPLKYHTSAFTLDQLHTALRESGLYAGDLTDDECVPLPRQAFLSTNQENDTVVDKRSNTRFVDSLCSTARVYSHEELTGAVAAHYFDSLSLFATALWLTKANFNKTSKEIETKLSSLRWSTAVYAYNSMGPYDVGRNLYTVQTPVYFGHSFSPIIAYGKNAAEPHYAWRNGTDPPREQRDVLLMDVGSHYSFGTTDTTRVFLSPTADAPILAFVYRHLRSMYTTTLRAHISVFCSDYTLTDGSFPARAMADRAASIVQNSRWKGKMPHALGHGIVAAGDVHSSLLHISVKSHDTVTFNDVFTIEPGLYEKDQGGVRIETTATVVRTSDPGFASVCPITFFPFCDALVQHDALTGREFRWYKTYQQLCTVLYRDLEIGDSGSLPNRYKVDLVGQMTRRGYVLSTVVKGAALYALETVFTRHYLDMSEYVEATSVANHGEWQEWMALRTNVGVP